MGMQRGWLSGLCLFALMVMQVCAAGTPTIEWSDPSGFTAVKAGSTQIRVIALRGHDLAAMDTSGRTFGEDVQVYARRDGGPWIKAGRTIRGGGITISRWGRHDLTLEFGSDAWLAVPGYLEFKAVVRGRPSNVHRVAIYPQPSRPPQLLSLGKTRFSAAVASQVPMSGDWAVRVRARDLEDLARATIGGLASSTSVVTLDNGKGVGVMDVFLPVGLRAKAGSYPLQIETSRGRSNSLLLTVVAAPVIVSVTPNYIQGGAQVFNIDAKARAGRPAEADLPVMVRFRGSAPDQVQIRPPNGGWIDVDFSTDGDAVTFGLAAAQRSVLGKLQIRLTNMAGESSAVVVIESTVRRLVPAVIPAKPPARPALILKPAQRAKPAPVRQPTPGQD